MLALSGGQTLAGTRRRGAGGLSLAEAFARLSLFIIVFYVAIVDVSEMLLSRWGGTFSMTRGAMVLCICRGQRWDHQGGY